MCTAVSSPSQTQTRQLRGAAQRVRQRSDSFSDSLPAPDCNRNLFFVVDKDVGVATLVDASGAALGPGTASSSCSLLCHKLDALLKKAANGQCLAADCARMAFEMLTLDSLARADGRSAASHSALCRIADKMMGVTLEIIPNCLREEVHNVGEGAVAALDLLMPARGLTELLEWVLECGGGCSFSAEMLCA
jgi:hypothetical protein